MAPGRLLRLTGAGGDGADPYAGYLLYADFTVGANTDLPSYTPEAGGPFAASAGAFDVKAATDDCQTLNTTVVATADIGQNFSDNTLWMAGGGGGDGAVGYIYRFIDNNNFLVVYLAVTNDQVWLYKKESGGWALINSASLAMDTGTYYKVRVLCTASGVYTVWVDDAQIITGTQNSFTASTKVALYNSAAAPAKWNDIRVV